MVASPIYLIISAVSDLKDQHTTSALNPAPAPTSIASALISVLPDALGFGIIIVGVASFRSSVSSDPQATAVVSPTASVNAPSSTAHVSHHHPPSSPSSAAAACGKHHPHTATSNNNNKQSSVSAVTPLVSHNVSVHIEST